MKGSTQKEFGFTLIELILVIALLSIALTITTINLIRPTTQVKLNTQSEDIYSIVKEAQNKAINTNIGNGSQSDHWGVHFEASKYVLFKGDTYDSADANNFVTTNPQNIVINPNLPCPSPPGDCQNIVFQRISGEVKNYDNTKNSICITETASNKNKLLLINFIGTLIIQNGC